MSREKYWLKFCISGCACWARARARANCMKSLTSLFREVTCCFPLGALQVVVQNSGSLLQ